MPRSLEGILKPLSSYYCPAPSSPPVPNSCLSLLAKKLVSSWSCGREVIKGTSKVRQSLPPDARESIQRLGARAEEILDVLEPATREVEYIPDDDLASLLSYAHTKSMRDSLPSRDSQTLGSSTPGPRRDTCVSPPSGRTS